LSDFNFVHARCIWNSFFTFDIKFRIVQSDFYHPLHASYLLKLESFYIIWIYIYGYFKRKKINRYICQTSTRKIIDLIFFEYVNLRHAKGDIFFVYFPFCDIRVIIRYLHLIPCKVSREHPLLDTYYKNRLAIKWTSDRRNVPAMRVNESNENSSSENIHEYLNTAEGASHRLVSTWHLRGVCGKLHRNLSTRTLVVIQVPGYLNHDDPSLTRREKPISHASRRESMIDGSSSESGKKNACPRIKTIVNIEYLTSN